MNNTLSFGLDLGYGAIKLYGRAGGVQLPAHVAAAQSHAVANLAGLEGEDRPLHIVAAGQPYYVGPGAHGWGRPLENFDYDKLAGSAEIVPLLYGAFTTYSRLEAIPERTPVVLYVGLPLEPLSGDPAAVADVLAAVRKWLIGVHTWKANGVRQAINVQRVEVTSQPAGAYFDYLLADDGRPHPQRAVQLREEIGIISIGFNTIERMAILAGKPVQKFTAGSTMGVRRLLERINEQAGNLYSLGELDAMLRNDELNTRNVIDEWSRQVSGELERTWGTSWKRFAHVVVVGGGALLLNGRLLPKFAGKASIPDEPVLAISRGLYKLALAQQKGN